MKNPFLQFGELTNKVNQIITNGSKNKMSDIQLLEKQITEWLVSPERLIQIQGDEYYRGIQDILNKKRTYKAADGKEYELEQNLKDMGCTVYKLKGIWIRKTLDVYTE